MSAYEVPLFPPCPKNVRTGQTPFSLTADIFLWTAPKEIYSGNELAQINLIQFKVFLVEIFN